MIAAYINHLVVDARAGGDLLEQLDADQECEHGRMPWDPTPECGCWAAGQLRLVLIPTVEPAEPAGWLGVAA